ncbi:hypothetical protein HPB48_026092 [Haemaphysalis longicornis]|uniref:Uncharacterized protein n=1 Tax=Haemaphysalis longicornis TaxID=44386 RepID=A0A9J6HAK2_HAELO|nr:hypothetical protein HPB48_026092 [Haemaphysalis longicornis]
MSERPSGSIRLVPAFGESINARVVSLPVSLRQAMSVVGSPKVQLLCAVTNNIAEGLDCLLSREDWELLTKCHPNREANSTAETFASSSGDREVGTGAISEPAAAVCEITGETATEAPAEEIDEAVEVEGPRARLLASQLADDSLEKALADAKRWKAGILSLAGYLRRREEHQAHQRVKCRSDAQLRFGRPTDVVTRNELESYIEDDAFQAEYNSVIEYQDHVTRVLTELKSRSARLSESATVISTTAENSNPQVTAPQRKEASLPKLTIAPFYGDLCECNKFWKQFDQMINQNSGLTVSQKCNYLRLFLQGEAASAVSGLQTTEACYKDGIIILNKTLGAKTRLEQENFARLPMLNPVMTSSDTAGLRELYDYMVVNIRGTETLGVKKSSFSSMLCDVLLRALPHDIFVQYHRTSVAQASTQRTDASQEEIDLDRLLTFHGMQLESLEMADSETWFLRSGVSVLHMNARSLKNNHPDVKTYFLSYSVLLTF